MSIVSNNASSNVQSTGFTPSAPALSASSPANETFARASASHTTSGGSLVLPTGDNGNNDSIAAIMAQIQLLQTQEVTASPAQVQQIQGQQLQLMQQEEALMGGNSAPSAVPSSPSASGPTSSPSMSAPSISSPSAPVRSSPSVSVPSTSAPSASTSAPSASTSAPSTSGSTGSVGAGGNNPTHTWAQGDPSVLDASAPSVVAQYAQSIDKWSKITGVPANLIGAVILKESWGDAGAVTQNPKTGLPDGGLMQIDSATYQNIIQPAHPNLPQLSSDPQSTSNSLKNPDLNIAAGSYLLADLEKQYANTPDPWGSALRAYNSGTVPNPNDLSQIPPPDPGSTDPNYVTNTYRLWNALNAGQGQTVG